MTTLSEEDLDNIEDDNEGDEDADESSSDKEEMKKILKTGKKEVDEFQSSQHFNVGSTLFQRCGSTFK